MSFVDDQEAKAVDQQLPHIAHQRFRLLDSRYQYDRAVRCQPIIGDAPVRAAIKAGYDDVVSELRRQLRLYLAGKRARGNKIERERRLSWLMLNKEQLLHQS